MERSDPAAEERADEHERPMSARLEELRPTRGDGSLLRTFCGTFLREVGGRITAAELITLFEALGVSGASVRTNLSRLKAKGLLVPERPGRGSSYRLADAAVTMLERGDRRIYGYRQMRLGDPWMVVVFSVPEAHRDLRHQLRVRLTWLGCGSMAPGAWIGPGHLVEETREVLGEVGLLPYATVLRTEAPLVAGDLAAAVARWWDLTALGERYDVFTGGFAPVAERWRKPRRSGSDAEAFADYLRAVDAWRSIPYLDPALPPELLPADWPGERGVALFAGLRERLAGPALRHVRTVTGTRAAAG